jgi:hypothetical protein
MAEELRNPPRRSVVARTSETYKFRCEPKALVDGVETKTKQLRNF